MAKWTIVPNERTGEWTNGPDFLRVHNCVCVCARVRWGGMRMERWGPCAEEDQIDLPEHVRQYDQDLLDGKV